MANEQDQEGPQSGGAPARIRAAAVFADGRLGDPEYTESVEAHLEALTHLCYEASVAGGWWHDVETGEPKERNKGEMIALIHSEISEAMEGERKNKTDEHLPHRLNAEVELADALIRIFDYAGGHGYDVAGAFIEKMRYNRQRADHKPENRAKDDGKKF